LGGGGGLGQALHCGIWLHRVAAGDWFSNGRARPFENAGLKNRGQAVNCYY
jgi:hypothetical protein